MLDELRKLIDRYLDHKSRSMQQLASRAGVSYSTVRRIAQGEVRSVELENVLGILKVVATASQTQDFLTQHYPSVGEYLSSVSLAAKIEESIDEDTERALADEEGFAIISLASMPRGTTQAEIVSTLGKAAWTKAQALIAEGVLEQDGDKVFSAQKEFASFDLHNVKSQVRNALPFLRTEHIGRKIQHCALHTKGMTVEGQRKVHALIQETVTKLVEIARDHEGPIPIFYGMVMGQFTSEEAK